MNTRNWVIGAIAGSVLAITGAVWWAKDGADTVQLYRLNYTDKVTVVSGRKLYIKHCASCHGTKLEGQTNWRTRKPDGRLPAPPHDVSGHTWHHPDQQLFTLTKFGPAKIVGGDYQTDMPSYEKTLSDDEILAVLAFIKSTWPEHVRERHDQINERAARQAR
ncbi:MAG: cytochrome c [Proteobacteria bacterium]|nr:cytochrome c [Pseudomonadota bacterium]